MRRPAQMTEGAFCQISDSLLFLLHSWVDVSSPRLLLHRFCCHSVTVCFRQTVTRPFFKLFFLPIYLSHFHRRSHRTLFRINDFNVTGKTQSDLDLDFILIFFSLYFWTSPLHVYGWTDQWCVIPCPTYTKLQLQLWLKPLLLISYIVFDLTFICGKKRHALGTAETEEQKVVAPVARAPQLPPPPPHAPLWSEMRKEKGR